MAVKKEMINVRIAAERLGMSAAHVRRMCANGIIEAQRLGHDWILQASAIKHITRQRKLKKKD